MPEGFADTQEPPYYAVIFTSTQTEALKGYDAMAEAMVDLAHAQPGCLGSESARTPNGVGITVSYFTDEESIRAWKAHADHLGAQKLGKERWYAHYEVRVARVERAYSGPQGR